MSCCCWIAEQRLAQKVCALLRHRYHSSLALASLPVDISFSDCYHFDCVLNHCRSDMARDSLDGRLVGGYRYDNQHENQVPTWPHGLAKAFRVCQAESTHTLQQSLGEASMPHEMHVGSTMCSFQCSC